MSIKYLGDNQLNQIQNSPSDSPWAKLIAQSEMLERSKLRQPQGQYPQGTVAGNIQQQLLADQAQQYNQVQNADAAKAQLLAQLIGSGHVQGMATGGSTIPALQMNKARYLSGAKQALQDYLAKESAPSDAYGEVVSALSGHAGGGLLRGFSGQTDGSFISAANTQAPALGPSPINPAKPQVSQPLAPTQLAYDKDPNEQTKKHDIFQRLLDQSIIGAVQGKANLNDTLQLYSDMFTGKALQGLAEGGEIRGFSGQTDGSFLSGRNYVGSQHKAPSFWDAVSGNLEPMFPIPSSAAPAPAAQLANTDYTALEALRRKQRGESPTPVPSIGDAALQSLSGFKQKLADILPSTTNADSPDWHAPMLLEEKPQPAAPAANITAPTTDKVTAEQAKAPVKPPITKDNVVAVAQAHKYDKQQSQVLDAAQKEAVLHQTEQAISGKAGEDVTETLYKQLKDADMDYSELAKRISENEKDLARERKDSDLISGLMGISAALTEAGNYKQVGDRVFRPSIAGIIGAGVAGGLGTSKALDKEYRTGIEKNLEALSTLQGLKRQARNDVMDAVTAERQSKVNEAHFKAVEQAERDKLNQYYIPSLKADEIRANASMLQATNSGGEDTASNKAIQRLNTQLDNITQMLNTEVTANGSDSDRAKQLRIMQDTYVNKINQLQGVGGAIGGTTPALTIPEGVKVTRRQG